MWYHKHRFWNQNLIQLRFKIQLFYAVLVKLFVPSKPRQDFTGDSVVRNLSPKAGDSGSIPGLGRYPRGGHGNPLQYSCLVNLREEELGRLQSMGWGVEKESDTT